MSASWAMATEAMSAEGGPRACGPTLGLNGGVAREPETVLIAEDDEELREQIANDLRSSGLKVVEVEDGLELEDYLEASQAPGAHLARADLIVSEAILPGMGGLAVLRHLHQNHSATPFIVIAPHGDAQAFEEAEELGAEYVLEKPLDLDDLRLAIFEAELASD